MVGRSRSGNNLHFAWARCRATVSGLQPALRIFLISSIWARGWCFGGSCSSATSAVANASVTTHSSWPVIPFFGIRSSPRLASSCQHHLALHRLRSKLAMLLRSGLQGNKGHAGDNPAYPLERPRREARQTEKSRGGEVEMTPVPTLNRPIQRPLSSVQTARRTGIAKAQDRTTSFQT